MALLRLISAFVFCFFFFFKQKPAYELLISDWSSDVCSSDLVGQVPAVRAAARHGGLRIAISVGDLACTAWAGHAVVVDDADLIAGHAVDLGRRKSAAVHGARAQQQAQRNRCEALLHFSYPPEWAARVLWVRAPDARPPRRGMTLSKTRRSCAGSRIGGNRGLLGVCKRFLLPSVATRVSRSRGSPRISEIAADRPAVGSPASMEAADKACCRGTAISRAWVAHRHRAGAGMTATVNVSESRMVTPAEVDRLAALGGGDHAGTGQPHGGAAGRGKGGS